MRVRMHTCVRVPVCGHVKDACVCTCPPMCVYVHMHLVYVYSFTYILIHIFHEPWCVHVCAFEF